MCIYIYIRVYIQIPSFTALCILAPSPPKRSICWSGRPQSQQVCIILARTFQIVWSVDFRHGLVAKPHFISLGLCLPIRTDVRLKYVHPYISIIFSTWRRNNHEYYLICSCLVYPISSCCSWSCFLLSCLSKFVLLSIFTWAPSHTE